MANSKSLARRMFRAPFDIEPKTRRMLLVVSFALLWDMYDNAMMVSAFKQIAEDLRMPSSDFGLYTALVKFGGLPAFLLVPVADRIGRRPVFIFSTVLVCLLTVATAFVQTPVQFALVQGVQGLFVVIAASIAVVIVTEELPAQHRGWGIGTLAAISSVGHGLAAILFARINDLPYGWRALYMIGIVPLFCLPLFLRFVPETQRFLAQRAQRGASTEGLLDAAIAPMRELFALQPKRAVLLSLTGLLAAASAAPTMQFSGYYTQTKLGWAPAKYSLMMLVAGFLSMFGNIIAGRLGDRYGRRIIGATLLTAFPLSSFVFFHGDSKTAFIIWVPLLFCLAGARVMLLAFSAELFQTAQRGAASGVFSVSGILGGVLGLLLVQAYGTPSIAEIGAVVPAVALLSIGCALIVLSFPETNQRELEDSLPSGAFASPGRSNSAIKHWT